MSKNLLTFVLFSVVLFLSVYSVWRISQPRILSPEEMKVNGYYGYGSFQELRDFNLIDHNGDIFTKKNLKEQNLNLENECNILLNNFYSNIWDWQFITNDILKKLNAYQRYEIVRIRMQHIIKLCQYQYGQQNIPLLPPIWNSQYNSNLLLHQILLQQTNNNNNPHILVYILFFGFDSQMRNLYKT